MKNKAEIDIEKICAKCERATILANSDNGYVLCSKKGIVKDTYCCKNFLYDPLKRIPSPPAKLIPFDTADISISVEFPDFDSKNN